MLLRRSSVSAKSSQVWRLNRDTVFLREELDTPNCIFAEYGWSIRLSLCVRRGDAIFVSLSSGHLTRLFVFRIIAKWSLLGDRDAKHGFGCLFQYRRPFSPVDFAIGDSVVEQ